MKSCRCIDKTNKALENAGYNSRVEEPFLLVFRDSPKQPRRCLIRTENVDSKMRSAPVKLFATFCPFCGVKYPEPKAPSKKRAASKRAKR